MSGPPPAPETEREPSLTPPERTQPAPSFRFRKPVTGPTPENLEDLARWRELTDESLSNVRAAAEKWRTGLAAFVTLATGGLLLKGPGAANDLPAGWLIPLTIFALGGLLAALGGLWLALLATAGAPARLNLNEVIESFGGIRQFEVASAIAVAARLRWARVLVAGSLLSFTAAIGIWWWAPPAASQPPAVIQVNMPSGAVCGTLTGPRDQTFTVRPCDAG